MSTADYINDSTQKVSGSEAIRMRPVVAAVIFSFLFHASTGWYLLKVAKEATVVPIRRPLEFNLIQPPQPIVTPRTPAPQPSFVPPKPIPIVPKQTPRIASQPKVTQPTPSTPPPAIESPKQLTEPLSHPEVIENPVAVEPKVEGSSEGAPAADTLQTEAAPAEHSVSGNTAGGEVADSSPGVLSAGDFIGPIFDAAYLSNPVPEYPSAARKLKLQGTTIVRVLVNPDGRAEVVQVEKSSGASVLDGAALKAVKKWLFVPARSGNKPVSAWVDVPIRFRLN